MSWIKNAWWWLIGATVAVLAIIFRPRGTNWAQGALEDEAQRHSRDAENARERARAHEQAADVLESQADDLEAQADDLANRVHEPDRSGDWRERHRRAVSRAGRD